MGGAAGAQATLDLSWRRRDRSAVASAPSSQTNECLGVRRGGRDLEAGDLFELIVDEVIETPLGTVGEDAGIALCQRRVRSRT